MSAYRYAGNFAFIPSLGLLDFPCPPLPPSPPPAPSIPPAPVTPARHLRSPTGGSLSPAEPTPETTAMLKTSLPRAGLAAALMLLAAAGARAQTAAEAAAYYEEF